MKGIILAAGRGSRMGSLTNDLPKCRTILHGKELIQWEMDAMTTAGIDDLAIIRGYMAETFDFKLKYFENKRWLNTNMVSSLLTASSWLENDECITSYSDIAYSSNTVKKLIDTEGNIVLSYDPNWEALWTMRFDNPLDDAETFKLKGNEVIEIGKKTNSTSEIEGQYMGLVKYTPTGWGQIQDHLKKYNRDDIDKLDMTSLLQNLINSGITIHGVAIHEKWFEVDTENDLRCYESNFAKSPLL